MSSSRFRFLGGWALTVLLFVPFVRADERMSQLKYNNPGLLVDLGVGLWAWPLPMDFNDDGLMDLVVACTDKPSNGVYLFLNTGEIDPVTHLPVLSPGRRMGAAGRSPQISYVNGQPWVTTAGNYHPDFKQTGLEKAVPLGDPEKIHLAEGRIRANQWKFVDFDGNGVLDLAVGIDLWGDYGWDDAWTEQGTWKNGPLRGYVYLLRNRGTDQQPDYQAPRETAHHRREAGGCIRHALTQLCRLRS